MGSLLDVIQTYELFDSGFGERYVLTNFVNDYLRRSIAESDRVYFTEKICAYYADLLKALYSFIELKHESSRDGNGSEMKKSNSLKLSQPVKRSRTKRDGPIKSKTSLLRSCLIEHLSDSPDDQKSVVEESLSQIMNIEHCIEMLTLDCENVNSIESQLSSSSTSQLTGSLSDSEEVK